MSGATRRPLSGDSESQSKALSFSKRSSVAEAALRADRIHKKLNQQRSNGCVLWEVEVPAKLLRQVTEDEIKSYHRDGAVLIKGVLGKEWIDLIASGLDEIYKTPGAMSTVLTTQSYEGAVVVDQCAASRNDKIQRVVMESPVFRVAAALARADAVSYLLDQVFYKERGMIVPTIWHQDTPFFRFRGHDIVRTWICCDRSPAKATVRVVRGSHLWNVTYRASSDKPSEAVEVDGKGGFSYVDDEFDKDLPPLPDIAGNYDSFDVMSWDVDPGDILAFNGKVLHGAFGNFMMDTQRRALAILWAGDDVVYKKLEGKSLPEVASLRGVQVETGELISDRPDAFPRLRIADSD
jgi:ectoine hydroxylase-related dioxygenase (phytanoyl-CoA dioxygenase family)